MCVCVCHSEYVRMCERDRGKDELVWENVCVFFFYT